MSVCQNCIPPPHFINAVPGHIFVGWGHGWQPCPHCKGTQEIPDPPPPPADVNRAYLELDDACAALELVRGSYDALAAHERVMRAALRYAAAELEAHPSSIDNPELTARDAVNHLRTKGTEP